MNKPQSFCVKGLLIFTMAFTPLFAGCSGSKTTSVSTTEVHRTDPDQVNSSTDSSHVEVTRKEEVTKDEEHHGIFSILADIIALPFRALAAIF